MKKLERISAKTISKLVSHDPVTGFIKWKARDLQWFANQRSCNRWNTIFPGTPAFASIDAGGYFSGQLFGTGYRAHRIIWALQTGSWPDGQIDHINGIRNDNRLVNLRVVSNQENSKNVAKTTRNTSGVVGVYWYAPRKKWLAAIGINGRVQHLGYYEKKEEAIAVRKSAENVAGFHKNHGRSP